VVVTDATGTPHYVGAVYGPPNPFPWGYCTWWVAHRRHVPWNGDAWQWWGNARAMGFREGYLPRVGAIMVIGKTSSSPLGHVAYVESVASNGSFTVSEMNWGEFGVEDLRTIPSTYGIGLLGFIY
jgi:surface antigen